MATFGTVHDFDSFPFDDQPDEDRSPTLAEWIEKAAQEVARRILAHCGGVVPTDTEQWRRCCESFGILLCELRRGQAFTALTVGTRGGSWWIFYNSLAGPERKVRYIVHELAEYMTREQSWHVQPDPAVAGLDSERVRHLVARRVEELMC